MRDFADGVQIIDISACIQIGHHAAATVVRSGHNGNWLLGNINAQFHAALHDVGKMFAQKRFRFVRNIEIDAIEAALFHLEVDGARHDIARCEFGALVVGGHEARAVGQFQQSTFAAHRFGNQKRFRVRMK